MNNEPVDSKNEGSLSANVGGDPGVDPSARTNLSKAKTTAKKPARIGKGKLRPAAGKKAKAVKAARKESKIPVTEKPVALSAPERTSQYVVTVDNATGSVTKIEKLDSTGKKQELSQDEYLQLAISAPLAVSNVRNLGSPFGAPASDNAVLTEAYYRGVVDYLHALGLA